MDLIRKAVKEGENELINKYRNNKLCNFTGSDNYQESVVLSFRNKSITN